MTGNDASGVYILIRSLILLIVHVQVQSLVPEADIAQGGVAR